MTNADFVARMIADMEAMERLPETMAFAVPPWWLDHAELLAYLEAMESNGQPVVVQQGLRFEPVPLTEWLAGLRRRVSYRGCRVV